MTKAVASSTPALWTQQLPNDCLEQSLRYLDPQSIVRCKAVHRKWYHHIHNNELGLWRPLCAQRYPDDFRENSDSITPRKFEQVVKTQWLAERRIPNRFFHLCQDRSLAREFLVCSDRICTPSAEVAYVRPRTDGLAPFQTKGICIARARAIPEKSYLFQGEHRGSPGNFGRVNLIHFYSGQSQPLFSLEEPILDLATSSTLLFVATSGKKIHVYDQCLVPFHFLDKIRPNSVKKIAVFQHNSPFTCMTVHGKHLLIAGMDGNVRAFSIPEFLLVQEISCGKGPISCLLAKHGKIYAGMKAPENGIAIFDLATGTFERRFSLKETNPPFEPESLCLHNNILWSGGSDGTLLKFNLITGQHTRIVPPPFGNDKQHPITCIRYASGKIFYGDGRRISSFNLTAEQQSESEHPSPIPIVKCAKALADLEWFKTVLRSNRDTLNYFYCMGELDQKRILLAVECYSNLRRPATYRDFCNATLRARLDALESAIQQRKRLIDEARLIVPKQKKPNTPLASVGTGQTTEGQVAAERPKTNGSHGQGNFLTLLWQMIKGGD